MQNDIIPPDLRRSNTNAPKKQPMPTLRLMGHNAEDAKKRLLKQEPAGSNDSKQAAAGAPSIRKPHLWLIHHLSKRSKIELAALAIVTGLGTGILVLLVM